LSFTKCYHVPALNVDGLNVDRLNFDGLDIERPNVNGRSVYAITSDFRISCGVGELAIFVFFFLHIICFQTQNTVLVNMNAIFKYILLTLWYHLFSKYSAPYNM
jgi:hypothetical protein